MTKAAIYTRISDDREGRGLGVKRQEADCRAAAEARGWTVAAVFSDNDTSAFSGRRRAGYEAMMQAIEAGQVGAVLAWHPDRLHRSPVELERFIDTIERARVKVATVQGGEYDLSNASGRMTARVVGAVARHESEHKSERNRRKAQEIAQAGRVGGGGTRPYGYAADRLTIDKAEAKVIRSMVRRLLAGESVRGVAADLNAKGISTVTGANWNPHVVRRLVMSGRIAGLREHRGKVIGEAEWSGIISRADHERLVAILGDPARRTNRVSRRYLLTGLAHCGLCGAKLVARPRDDGRRRYVCATGPGFSGCGRIYMLAGGDADPDPDVDPVGLEDLMVEAVLQRLDSPAVTAKLTSPAPSDDELVDELAALEARLEQLAESWADGEIDRRSWLTARARIDDRIVAARNRLVEHTRPLSLAGYVDRPGALRKAWPGLTFDQRRAVMHAVIDRVTIGPAVRGRTRFDAERVDVEWLV